MPPLLQHTGSETIPAQMSRVYWRAGNSLRYIPLIILLFVWGCAAYPGNAPHTLNDTVISGSQLLVAVAESRYNTTASIYTLERLPNGWRLRSGPLRSMIGRNGFASPGEKREGDGKVPSGLFPLEFAFGYAPSLNSKLPYRQATTDDLWVDDVDSPDYNTWVKRGKTTARSFEVMKMDDIRYSYGLVTGYNRNPVIKGYGSGIFVHVWLYDGYPTSGCVALDAAELVSILAWLDPAQQPQILMGTREDLAVVEGLPPLPALP